MIFFTILQGRLKLQITKSYLDKLQCYILVLRGSLLRSLSHHALGKGYHRIDVFVVYHHCNQQYRWTIQTIH